MLSVIVSMSSGVFSAALTPGYTVRLALSDSHLYRGLRNFDTHGYAFALAYQLCVVSCMVFCLSYRRRVRRRDICVALAVMAAAGAGLPWVASPIGHVLLAWSLFCSETFVWLAALQLASVLDLDETAFNFGLLLGALLRTLPLYVGHYVFLPVLVLSAVYAAMHDVYYALEFVDDSLLSYRLVRLKYRDRLTYADSLTVLRVCSDLFVCAGCICVISSAIKTPSSSGFMLSILLVHLRVEDLAGPGLFYCTWFACASLLTCEALTGSALARVAVDVLLGTCGCVLRNHVSDRFGRDDAYSGNTVCAVCLAFVLPHVGSW